MEEAALSLLQRRILVTLTHQKTALPPSHPGSGWGAMMRVVVEGVRNSEDLVCQVDPEDLEEVTQIRAVTRATAQLQFTEAGMSRVRTSQGASCEKQMR